MNNIKHLIFSSYTLMIGQSGNTKNWPGYACKPRIKHGRNAHNEDEIINEHK